MTIEIRDQQIDLYEYPKTQSLPADTTELIIGDLHGNPVVLINRLMAYGIISLPEKDYDKLIILYYFTSTLDQDKHYIKQYIEILSEIKIINPDIYIRLIGDETGDRGANDFLMLKIFELMGRHIKFEIIFSNHGFEFIAATENFQENLGDWNGRPVFFERATHTEFMSSLVNLVKLVKNEVITNNELQELVIQYYLPKLKLISYSLDPKIDSITIYSHAPIGLDTIKKLAPIFGVAYNDDSSHNLIETIDAINEKFLRHATKYRDCASLAENHGVIEYCIWNREYPFIERPTEKNGFHIKYVHGHDSNDPYSKSSDCFFSIDGLLGKDDDLAEGKETTLISNESNALKLANTSSEEQFASSSNSLRM